MAGPRTRNSPANDSVANVPQSTPEVIRTGQPGHDFVLQAVMELQLAVGKLDAKLDGVKTSIDSTKSKVDDLVGWKNKILGGVAVLVAIIAAMGFLAGKASEYLNFTLKPVVSVPAAAQPPSRPASGT